MAGGDFSPEAYEKLRAAYADQQQKAVDIELAGKDIQGLNLGLETGPVDSPWKDRIKNWEYPSGKSDYKDGKQSPEEILQIMRESAQKRLDEKEEAEPETENEEEETDSEEEEIDIAEMSDEEFDKYLVDKYGADEDEELEEDEEEEEGEEEEEETVEEDEESEPEEDEPETEEETEEYDPEEIAEQIAALKAEMEAMQFNTPETEEQSDDESE